MKLALPLAVLAAALLGALAYRSLTRENATRDAARASDAHDATPATATPSALQPLAAGVETAAERDAPARMPLAAAEVGAERGGALVVRVVDTAGQALAGIGVELVDAGVSERGRLAAGVSGPDGLVALDVTGLAATATLVAARGLFSAEHAVAVSLRELPDEPVALVVPPFGSLLVTVVDGSGASADANVVLLTQPVHDRWGGVPPAPHAAGSLRVRTDGGPARVEHVEAGIDAFAIAVAGSAQARARFNGPAAGEVGEVVLELAGGDTVLTGRVEALAPKGVTGSGWSWTVVDLATGERVHPGGRTLETAQDGAFALRIRQSTAAALTEHAWLLFALDGAVASLHPLAGRLLPGTHDVGLVSVPGVSTLVAGRAVMEDGASHANAPLRVMLAAPGAGEPHELLVGGWCETDADGRFHVGGRGDARLAWSVEPSERGIELVRPATFVPGETELLVVVRSAGASLVGRVLVDDAGGGRSFLEHLVVAFQPVDAGLNWRPVRPGADGAFEVREPPLPACRLIVRPLWHPRPIVQLEDVTPEGPRERLEIDLRGRLVLAELRGFDATGAALAFSVREAGAPLGGPSQAVPVLERITVLLDRAPQDMIASAAGYRDVRLEGLDCDRDVRFERAALPVRLVWSDLPEVGSEARLVPLLVADDQLAENVHLHADFRAQHAFDLTGRVTLGAPAPGTYTVLLQVEARDAQGRRRFQVHDGAAPRITVSDADEQPEFAVRWDPESVRALAVRLAEAKPR